jgi:hypothetical protein
VSLSESGDKKPKCYEGLGRRWNDTSFLVIKTIVAVQEVRVKLRVYRRQKIEAKGARLFAAPEIENLQAVTPYLIYLFKSD